MRISRPRSSDRRQGSGRVPRAVMRKRPNRLVMLRGGRAGGGLSAVVRRHFRAWQDHSTQGQTHADTHPESAPLMSLTPNEISDLNDLLIKLSLSEPMPGIVYDSIMYDDDEELDIQTQPLHDDGQPREAITALTCPTPRIPGLTLSSPLLNLPDLDLDGRFESQPEVQNMLLQLIESANIKDATAAPAQILASEVADVEKAQETRTEEGQEEDKTEATTTTTTTTTKDAVDDSQVVTTIPERSSTGGPTTTPTSSGNSDSSPSYRIILIILILMYYSREINKGFVVPDQALDIIQHLELCRSRPLPVITPDPTEA